MRWSHLTSSFLLCQGLTAAQQVGSYQNETHPKLQWSSCTVDGGCQTVNGEIAMDANFRWLHKVDNYMNCFSGNTWEENQCSTVENCTNTCALDGADYARVYGVKVTNSSVSQRFKTNFDFAYNVGSRLFLLESKHKYQMFTLKNNELAFDVDLSTVECGINGALYFVPMDADGGQTRYATNKAGAEYGTGYCDASCPRDLKFVGGKANMEAWIPSETDPFSGKGLYGACCPQFSVWNSNAHSFEMSSHVCPPDRAGPTVCGYEECDNYGPYGGQNHWRGQCDRWGCSYNPYRMGNTAFYGKGKTVDTGRKFTVVTQWSETKVTQFFIQDGQKIELPAPVVEGLPKEAGLSADMCSKQRAVFGELDTMAQNGGWETHNRQLLSQPMVLVMSIGADVHGGLVEHQIWAHWIYGSGLKM
ncbi:glycoside hydrolase [Parachaetomium inaequale]|uniref:Glucanase n=1 Tax=Parachaetomium inaequale TaxID=2588326 RepID=A0AAN6SVX6_9PEZI|nr:glycoside hydrolase [Parachaetomium inaequale]